MSPLFLITTLLGLLAHSTQAQDADQLQEDGYNQVRNPLQKYFLKTQFQLKIQLVDYFHQKIIFCKFVYILLNIASSELLALGSILMWIELLILI